MEFEFDKEIDVLLRKARESEESALSAEAHPDADEISAFAENALPAVARQAYAAHLADCPRCRKILSNIITLNAATNEETQTAVSTFPAGVAAERHSWFRRLFAFPQIAYAMGALVLLFSGFLAYIVLQNATDSKEATVARREEKNELPNNANVVNPNGETVTPLSANTTENQTNSAAFSNAATNKSAAVTNSNTAVSTYSTNAGGATANANVPAGDTMPILQATPPQKTEDDEVVSKTDSAEIVMPAPAPPAAAPIEKAAEPMAGIAEKKKVETDDARKKEASPMPRSQPAPMIRKSAEPDETRRIEGKNFRRVGGIWFDEAYTTQPQIPVRRGSDEYKRLDTGLRSIAEKLSGTVVVLWKDKAYRIQ